MRLQAAKVTTSLVTSQTNPKDLSTPQADIVKKYEQSYAEGTAADQAQVVFADSRTVAASGTDNLDLAGGLTHELGGTITFTAIKEIIVVPTSGTGTDLRVGKGVSNAFVGPFGASAPGNLVGRILHHGNDSATGWAVTPGTGDILSIENLGGSTGITYDIVIIGEGSVA
jgi:hypothetical protein